MELCVVVVSTFIRPLLAVTRASAMIRFSRIIRCPPPTQLLFRQDKYFIADLLLFYRTSSLQKPQQLNYRVYNICSPWASALRNSLSTSSGASGYSPVSLVWRIPIWMPCQNASCVIAAQTIWLWGRVWYIWYCSRGDREPYFIYFSIYSVSPIAVSRRKGGELLEKINYRHLWYHIVNSAQK